MYRHCSFIWRGVSLSALVPREKGMSFAIETKDDSVVSRGVQIEEMFHSAERAT